MMPFPTIPLTYWEILVLHEGHSVLRETLEGIKVQPLPDGHKLARTSLWREGCQWSKEDWHSQPAMDSGRQPGPHQDMPFPTHADLKNLLGSQTPNEGIDGCQIPSSYICQLPDEFFIQLVLLDCWQGSSIHSLC
jgi:hypothetical protein